MVARRLLYLAIVSAFVTVGCSSGDGSSSDPSDTSDSVQQPEQQPEQQQPEVSEPAAEVSEFRQIQDSVFTPICAECHGSGGASAGLRLDDGASFAALVDVPSVEVPALNRVSTGDPDNSYLVQKIEGTATVGGRMPLGGARLPQDSIDLIRSWISAGALPETDSSVFAVRVASTSVSADSSLSELPNELVVVFTEPVDGNTVNSASFSLTRSGGDGSFSDGNEINVPFEIQLSDNGLIARLDTSETESVNDLFQLGVLGGNGSYVLDSSGERIDGDSDGLEGGDFIQRFTVGSAF